MENLFEEKIEVCKNAATDYTTEGVAPVAIVIYVVIGAMLVKSCSGE